ncbi:MAG TPA: orotidine-5'-phosphate decarboxylase [Acidimicrobiia bacterium]|nr:orotidine-5'-phosphate decarboxylase [Acidimicrobiia bacterium]
MTEVRDRLALALDVDDLDDALVLARRLEPWFGIAKVGYELYGTAGPEAFDRLRDMGFQVFADLKLHDIPTTVERGARSLARHGVGFVNAHAAGGEVMLRAFVAGLHEGARDVGAEPPAALAVTVLTSEPDANAFDARLDRARVAGCDGVVCSAYEIARVSAVGLTSMVPGIRLPDTDLHDQARAVTPADALAAGATWLVVGRTVTAASDPEAAADQVSRSAAAGSMA